MKIQDVMTRQVIAIDGSENVAVAARTLARCNIGALPVCGPGGTVQGVVTDRDLVIRCVAAGKDPNTTRVSQVMTGAPVTVTPDTDGALAAAIMGRRQVRRLPVVEGGKLCGMVSIGDLARADETAYDAGDALAEISANVSDRG